MTTTEQIENFKMHLSSPTKKIGRGLNTHVLLGTAGVLIALFTVGFVPRWRANTARMWDGFFAANATPIQVSRSIISTPLPRRS